MVFASGRGRPPTATIESGAVSWDEDSDCFVGENGYYWHGAKYGGWLTEKPSKKQRMSVERRTSGTPATPGTPGRKGRKPRPPESGVEVIYDEDEDCYKTDGGLYWHGSMALGQRGWTDYPPSQADDHELPIPNSGGKKSRKGRPPACDPSFGTDVYYDMEDNTWKTDKDFFWTGSTQLGGRGWVKNSTKKKKNSRSSAMPRKRAKLQNDNDEASNNESGDDKDKKEDKNDAANSSEDEG
eukprot:CAMPEP_0172491756 /NCGR_PEP_ID=MMETSP1066-20121228/22612_1 /TAXON_ID=671091 /ORGANISM="Coscinodiscus wailesii, Strain CCMP2513" /LENGTH=239 /DNA_ID=CAMNT_0013260949 /DNA_START=21 /DNA_END=740 /DNA_ORIENTATION=-